MPRIRSSRAARPGAGSAPEVVVSSELYAPVSADVELCYQTFGDPSDEPLLLVMGLGGHMTWWDADLCTLLARQGFYVVRYDNRDVGRSSAGTASPAAGNAIAVGGRPSEDQRLDRRQGPRHRGHADHHRHSRPDQRQTDFDLPRLRRGGRR